MPVLSLPVELVLALRQLWATEPTPQDRIWARRLLGLAAVDLLLTMLFVGLIVAAVAGSRPFLGAATRGPSSFGPRIGVQAGSLTEDGTGARLGAVLTGSPADRAGLRAGDVVVSVDGNSVPTFDSLRTIIASGKPGVSRTMRIRRGDQEFVLVVTPERRPRESIFRPWPNTTCNGGVLAPLRNALEQVPLGLGVMLMAALWAVGSWRGQSSAGLWCWVLLALAGANVAWVCVNLGLCRAIGGQSVGGSLLSFLAYVAVPLGISLAAKGQMARSGLLTAELGPRLKPTRAAGLAVFYITAIGARLWVLLTGVERLSGYRLSDTGSRFSELFQGSSPGWEAAVLLLVSLDLIGPVGEEVLFRGVVLPRLYGWLGPLWASIWTSLLFALLHLDYGSYALTVFLASLLLCWARLRTGGLAAPIAVHMLVNFLATILSLFR